jgi:hypothetical protein
LSEAGTSVAVVLQRGSGEYRFPLVDGTSGRHSGLASVAKATLAFFYGAAQSAGILGGVQGLAQAPIQAE